MTETRALDEWNAARVIHTNLRVRRSALVRLKRAVAGAQAKGVDLLLHEVVAVAFELAAESIEIEHGPLPEATLGPGRRKRKK